MDVIVDVTFKFGGYWTYIKNQGRRRYDGWRQKSFKLKKDLLTYDILEEQVKIFCPWIIGCDFQLYYLVYGLVPKEYKLIKNNVEVIDMISQSVENHRIEIIVSTEESHDGEAIDGICLFEHYHPSIDCTGESNNDLQVVSGNYVRSSTEENKILTIGAHFNDSKSFKHALRSEAIRNNFGIRTTASNSLRVVAVCSHRGCPWRIRAALCADGQTFEIRKLISTHTCPGINRAGNKQATSSWVAKEIESIVKNCPNIPPKQINNNLENKFGLSLPYMKLWRSREQAKDCIFGSTDDSFKWVPTLAAELIKRSPVSHITYSYDEYDNSFQRFYISFKVCIDGFLAGCRHLIGLDVCHLKSKHLGMLLSATSLDGDNGLFTITFAVAESESKRTWKWFLENLSTTMGYEIHPLAFISDMKKGLGEAIREIFPNAEHRVCLRHLWKNLKKFFHCNDSHKLRQLVWSAANSCIPKHFHNKMNEVYNDYPQVHEYLASLPYKWSKSQFSIEIKNPYNTNNMAESFNAWIGEARNKLVVDLVDLIREMIMMQRCERKHTSSTWRGMLVPYAEEYIRDITTRKEQFIIRESSPSVAEIEDTNERHQVLTLFCKFGFTIFGKRSCFKCYHDVFLFVLAARLMLNLLNLDDVIPSSIY